MKCYYHNDLDGRCAGAIVWGKYKEISPDIEFIEVDYKDKIDVAKIDKGEQIIIVDFSFKPDVMKVILDKTKAVIWIDHHKTAESYNYGVDLAGLRNFEDKKYSGCELTWAYFYGKPIPRAVEFVGDRDCWRWNWGQETAKFNQGLATYPHQPKDEIWNELLKHHCPMERLIEIAQIGDYCIQFRDNFCKDYADSYGFETEFEGHKCFALGIYMFGSEAFGERFAKYDICLSYEFCGDKWIIGLYSKTVDVSVIAKKYGGGGHTGASGFVYDKLPFFVTPTKE